MQTREVTKTYLAILDIIGQFVDCFRLVDKYHGVIQAIEPKS